MRKNKMMRTASALLVATLLTASVLSGTFAKYTTNGTGTDTARVAKWGVTVTANGTTFAKEYAKTDESTSIGANSVVSTEDVVAPGTSGDMASMKLAGTPEVAVKVTYAGEFALNDQWKVDGAFYCPLEITVNNDTIKGTDYTDSSKFVEAVNAKINSYSQTYEPGTNLGDKGNDSLKVSWNWPFTTTDNDAKDTALGTAASGDSTAATVTLKVTTTVTQID